MFVRENKSEDGVTYPYTYLGHADIVSYSGSKPIIIVWKLRNKLPASIADPVCLGFVDNNNNKTPLCIL